MPTKKSQTSRSSSRSSKPVAKTSADAFSLLKADHQKVQKLFKEFEKLHSRGEAEEEQLQELATQICNEITVHAQVEEEIFYPALRDALEDQDLLDEAQVEHESAKTLIAQIEEGGDEELFAARVIVLGEYVRHHIEEEESEMFPAAKKAKVDSAALGEAMAARKSELMTEMGLGEESEEEDEADISVVAGAARRRRDNGSTRSLSR